MTRYIVSGALGDNGTNCEYHVEDTEENLIASGWFLTRAEAQECADSLNATLKPPRFVLESTGTDRFRLHLVN